MAHKILGERFISRTEPAWHKLGSVFPQDEEITASEAVGRVAGDVRVTLRPLSWQDEDGTSVQMTDEWAVVRMPTKEQKDGAAARRGEVLGTAGRGWVPTSYVDLASHLDELSRAYKVETCGLLEGGGLCFLSLRGEDWAVAGDEMRTYFLVDLSLQPGKAHKVHHTPVRVVCWNTQVMAEGKASISLSIQHAADAAQRIGMAANLVARFRAVQARTKDVFETFAIRSVTGQEVDQILLSAYEAPRPSPRIRLLSSTLKAEEQEIFRRSLDEAAVNQLVRDQGDYESAVSRHQELISTARARFEEFDGQAKGTLWAAYNAVTEVSDWRNGRGKEIDSSTVWGTRGKEKARAFATCLQIAGIN